MDINNEEDFNNLPTILPPDDILRAAANHALATGDSSALSKPMSISEGIGKGIGTGAGIGAGALAGSAFGPLGTVVGGIIGGITGYDWRATAATTVSAANQLYNSTVSIANIVPGVDAQERDIHAWMGGMDSDLSKYYDMHKPGIDTAGFIVSSIPAGLGALKLYNYGAKMLGATAAAGELGLGTSEATGLLIPRQAAAFKAASEAAVTNGAKFNAVNAKFIAATAYGAGEQAIQGLVFEAGVQTLLNKSPLLEDQDASDIAHNLWTGTWISGVAGGVFGGIGLAAKIGKAIRSADKEVIGAQLQEGTAIGSKTYEDIALSFENQAKLDVTEATTETVNKLKAQAQTRTNNQIDDTRRASWQSMTASNDSVVGNMMHEMTTAIFYGAGKSTEAVRRFTDGVVGIARPGVLTKEEKAVEALRGQINAGKTINSEDFDLLDRYSTKIVNTWGERFGQLDEAPKDFKDLWSKLEANQIVSIKKNAVVAGSSKYNVDFSKPVDFTTIKNVDEANARILYAHKTTDILKDGQEIGINDIAALEKAYKDITNGSIKSVSVNGNKLVDSEEVLKQLVDSKINVFNAKIAEDQLSLAGISSLVNAKQSRLMNTGNKDISDFFALQTFEKAHLDLHKDVKISDADILTKPNQIKVIYDTSIIDKDAMLATPFIARIKANQKAYDVAAKTAAGNALGADTMKDMIAIPKEMMDTINRYGAGSSLFRAADSIYGSLGSVMERVGQVHDRAFNKAKQVVSDNLTPTVQKLYGNARASADYAAVMNQVGNTSEKYIIHPTEQKLIHKDYMDYLDGVRTDLPKLGDNVKLEIPVETKEAYDLIVAHTSLNDSRLGKFSVIRALGNGGKINDPGIVYAPPVDLRHYKHYAFVSDTDSITGTGSIKMIWGKDARHLEDQLAQIPEEFQSSIIREPKVKTGKEVERWKKAIGDYERDDALTQNYFNSAIGRKGTSAHYQPPTDPEIIRDHLVSWHHRQERNLIDESFGAYYSKEFDAIKKLAELWSDKSLSKLGSYKPGELVKEISDNPYMSYMRTALNMPNVDKIPFRTTQTGWDESVSKIWNSAKSSINGTTKPEDLDVINDVFKRAGITPVTEDSLSIINQSVDKGTLSTITRRANAIVASIGLGWDVLNALNNRVGSLIMLAPETNYLIDAIKAGNKDIAGELAELAHVKVPGSANGYNYLSTGKLVAQATKEAFSKEAREWAASKGFSIRHMQDVEDIIDTIAFRPNDSKISAIERLDVGYHKLMRFNKRVSELTGNAYAEEQTRVVAALVAKKITDLGVKGGIISERVADSYIQTFVNRTNGIYLASQRPMLFNGPIGQAMGLYQTYMATLMNNYFRYVTTGSHKSAAMMTALQGGIYGIAGLPAFQAINTHLVGGFAGNTDNTDIYGRVYNSTPKEAADWLMFGALSNVTGLIHPDLKMNMYTRGDVSPRNITIVPLNPAEMPAVAITSKFINNFIDFGNNIANGGDFTTTMLRGLEHNGISRPLAGIAQTLEAFGPTGKSFGTTQSGKLISANDLLSLHNVTRIAGAKSLDDAIAMDAEYRSMVYKAKDNDVRSSLAESMRSKMVGGRELSDDDLHEFTREYIKTGGNQNGFNKLVSKVKREVSYSASNRISLYLKGPDGQNMQRLMGGITANDFMINQAQESGLESEN